FVPQGTARHAGRAFDAGIARSVPTRVSRRRLVAGPIPAMSCTLGRSQQRVVQRRGEPSHGHEESCEETYRHQEGGQEGSQAEEGGGPQGRQEGGGEEGRQEGGE